MGAFGVLKKVSCLIGWIREVGRDDHGEDVSQERRLVKKGCKGTRGSALTHGSDDIRFHIFLHSGVPDTVLSLPRTLFVSF